MSAKRPHERGPSLSLRPHKSAKTLSDDANGTNPEDELMSIDDDLAGRNHHDKHSKTLWENLRMISSTEPLVVPPLQFLGRTVRPLTTFDISGITAWPSSLGAIRNQFRYNLTPQNGPTLPRNVLNLTAWKGMTSGSNNTPGPVIRAPYMHLGFTTWLNIDIYVFLPNLSLGYCIDQDPGRPQEQVLEAWTDSILLPALSSEASQSLPSWAQSKQSGRSAHWYDPAIAAFPTCEISGGTQLDRMWDKIRTASSSFNEFQDAFLIMHMDKRHDGVFTGGNPEIVFRDFEHAWMQEIDTRFIDLGRDNLKISVSCDIAA